jgi:hypothetical protein
MTFRSFLLFMLGGTLIAIGAWVFVMSSVNPYDATLADMVLFYLTLFMSLIGILSLLGSLYRVLLLRRRSVISREVNVAFRHAIFLSIAAIMSMILLTQGVFHWWILFVLILILSVFEFVALKIQQADRR